MLQSCGNLKMTQALSKYSKHSETTERSYSILFSAENRVLLRGWRLLRGPLLDYLWRKEQPDTVFVYFSNCLLLPSFFIMPHCLRQVAVTEVAVAVISCWSGDFLHRVPLWDADISHVQGMWWMMGLLPVRISLSLGFLPLWHYCSVVGHSEHKLSR